MWSSGDLLLLPRRYFPAGSRLSSALLSSKICPGAGDYRLKSELRLQNHRTFNMNPASCGRQHHDRRWFLTPRRHRCKALVQLPALPRDLFGFRRQRQRFLLSK